MKASITYRLTDAAQREALRRGINAALVQTVEIDDPDCILLDHITVDTKGTCTRNLYNHMPALGATTEYFDRNVNRTVYGTDFACSYQPFRFDLIETAEQALAAILYHDTGKKAELLADRDRLQAEADADFETRKDLYVANHIANVQAGLADLAAHLAASPYATAGTGYYSAPSFPHVADFLDADHPVRAQYAQLKAIDDEHRQACAARDAEEAAKPKVLRVNRVALTDGTGRWFDANRAIKFSESTTWNGNNHISDATGSQWDHEALYRTASCRYILNRWSQYQGTIESYYEIDASAAAAWLSTNGADADRCCESEFAALEIN